MFLQQKRKKKGKFREIIEGGMRKRKLETGEELFAGIDRKR